MLKDTFNFDKYEKNDKSISIVRANVYALFMLIPAFLCFALYGYVWDFDIIEQIKDHSVSFSFLLAFYMVVLIILHEFTHGIVLGHFCVNKRKSISYGIDPKTLSPYCHCAEILTINQIRLGYAAPLFTTGILPFLIALATGHAPLMLAGVVLIVSAGGDCSFLVVIAKEKKTAFAEDHPSAVGCIVYRPKS